MNTKLFKVSLSCLITFEKVYCIETRKEKKIVKAHESIVDSSDELDKTKFVIFFYFFFVFLLVECKKLDGGEKEKWWTASPT